jgi:hypothetical protein
MRARDADREEAVDFIEAAYSDGQLTREEYDVRTGKALRAQKLTELDRLVRDLQRPGTTRVAARLTRLAEATGRPAPTRNQVTMANALTGSARRFLVGVGVLALTAFVVFFLLPWLLFRDTAGVADEPEAAPVDLLTADGFRTFVDAVEARTGDTVVFSAFVGSEHYGGAMVPADATSDRYVQWTWRDAGFEDGESTGSDLDAMRFDLSRIDPAAIPGLVEQAGDLVEEPESFSLHIDPDEYDLKGECYRISAGNRFSEYGDITASCSGRVLEVDPPD